MIVVNAGLGSALDAAALVAYVNLPVGLHAAHGNDADGPAGVFPPGAGAGGGAAAGAARGRNRSDDAARWATKQLERAMVEEPRRRSRNGEALPWQCRWWGVGNEMYGPWQLGAAPFAAFVEVLDHAKRPSWRDTSVCVRMCARFVSLEMHGSWHIHLQTHMGWALFENVSP